MKKIKDYVQLVKLSLSIMVVFSSVISYLLAPKVVEYQGWMILLLFVGGMLVTGSANAINQVVEKDTDALMKRTANRPLASGRMSVGEGWAFAVITGVLGVFILGYYFNLLSAGLAAFSLFLYAFIYTPLKKVNSIAVLVGAVPGALPCLIGWAAGDDQLSMGGWILFGIQFLWQFPHFWAIAWVAHQDYSRVGFKLLPADKGPTKFTALQTVIYSLLLLPVTLIPYFTGMCSYDDVKGVISLVLILLANLFMLLRCITLYRKMDVGSARQVMFGSYMYLPVVLLALLMSKNLVIIKCNGRCVESAEKKLHPHKFTLWVAIASILMMFAGLTSAFIVKSNLVGWREIEMPKAFWGSTAAIVLSSITIQMALRSFKQREMRKYRQLVGVTLFLGLVFVALQCLGFWDLWTNQNVKFTGTTGAGQFLYIIFGLHALHVIGGVIVLIVMFLRAFFGKVKNYSSVPVEVAATYWHFVDILWIYLLLFFIVIG